MLRSLKLCCAVVVLGGPAASSAPADVIFDNFAPGDTYLSDTGWSVAWGVDFGVDLDQAAVFDVSGGDYFLDTIEIAIGHLFGPDLLFIDVHADDEGAPGEVVDSTTVSGIGPFGEFNPPVAADFGGDTILEDGLSYWVSISTVNDHAWFAWNYNIVGDLGLRAHREDLGPWETFTGDPRGTFRVNATPTADCPEDLDGSGDVGFADLLAVLNAWGPCAGCPEDIDGDETVGFTDLLAVLNAWGACP